MSIQTNSTRAGGTPTQARPVAPIRSSVPPGAQPGMTPTPGVGQLKAPPPKPEEAWAPAPAEPTGTVLDELMEAMDPMMWQVFLAIVTYTQLIDDIVRGEAQMSPAYEGAVLAPFLGFGPPHLWAALQQDLKHTLLRTIVRWLKDPQARTDSTLTWRVMDQVVPGFCLMTKGDAAFKQSLVILERIKPEFA